MKYSDIAIKIAAAKECGIITSNAQFWKEFQDIKLFEETIKNNGYFLNTMEKLIKDFSPLNHNSGIVCAFDDEFPVINKNVKNNGDKPFLLFYNGCISLLEDLNKNVAVIGSLDPDNEIIKRETGIIKELVKNELIIVSGLARGCDTIAHKICLEESGKTIAVLPSQLNKIYPAENRSLAEKIISGRGLLLSEYYKEPESRNESINRLIERDRLQAMFSKAVILIASYNKGEGDSGSRHAMEAANKYEIKRFVMYNKKTDENNKRFGLNKYLLNKNEENVKILCKKNITELKMYININLKKRNYNIQNTFDYN